MTTAGAGTKVAAAFVATAAAALEPTAVPTLAEAIAQAPEIVRVKVIEVTADGMARVEVREVYFGEFENVGWVDLRYDVPAEGGGVKAVALDVKVGAQYVLFAQRDVGGVYLPYLYWNTRWGVADVVDDELDLSRLAEGTKRAKLTEFRELVRQVKWGM